SDVEPQYFRQVGYDPDKPILPDGTQRGDSHGHGNGNGNGNGNDNGHEGEHDDLDFDDGEGREATQTKQRRSQQRQRPGIRPRIKPPIQEIFQRGDEVVVQVIKEGIGTKGPTLSTYISIPGRYVVLMPALGRIGVSRKIES